ncbi:MAG TPA: PAS domain-containing protein [Geothrix sp.]|nr:PAS domain-containing protein [Geothrix sp.]
MAHESTPQDLGAQWRGLNEAREVTGPEAIYRACLETLSDGVVFLSALRSATGEIEDFRFDYINEAGCRLNHRQREDIEGHRLLELLRLDLGELFEAFRQVVGTEAPLSREVYFPPDPPGTGQRRFRALDLRAVKVGDGLAITWRDTTARCQAEAALRDQTSRFRAIFEYSSEAILLTSPDGSILAANPAACRITGRSETDICAGGRAGMVDVSDPRTGEFIETRRREGHARGEMTLKRGDGSRFPAMVSSTIFRNSEGEERTVMLFYDLSELKRLEARSERLAALVVSTEDAIYASDMEGVITDWNDGAVALYGYSAAEAIGKPPSLIVPQELLPETRSLLRTLSERQRLRNYETLRKRKDGTLIHVALTASPIVHGDGTIAGISVIARDITVRVQSAAERERLIEELRTALADVQILSGLVPICSWCKRIRDDSGYWTQVESYIQEHSPARFTHGICPQCAANFYPEATEDSG